MSKKRLDDNFVPWKELLNRATLAGLHSTVVTVIQVPSEENGYMAVVHARVLFEDGRSFEDVGDASPANCNDSTAVALLRMASTRAKARCHRDALNIGEVAEVELAHYPNTTGHPTRPSGYGPSIEEDNHYAPQNPETRAAVSHLHGPMVCSNDQCRRPLTATQFQLSNRTYGAPYCPACQKLVQRVER